MQKRLGEEREREVKRGRNEKGRQKRERDIVCGG